MGSYTEQIGRENFRVLLDDRRRIVAGLGIFRPGQWFGGREIPMGAIAAVGVKPELRGGGIAFALMSAAVREMRALGMPLSALYASTSRLYRKVGYEHAGSAYYYEVSTADLGGTRPGADPLRPVRDRSRSFRTLHRAASRA
ncbi:MAG: GNAT family N-acetyltransferase [Candidatus Eisenbacteria bacterium]